MPSWWPFGRKRRQKKQLEEQRAAAPVFTAPAKAVSAKQSISQHTRLQKQPIARSTPIPSSGDEHRGPPAATASAQSIYVHDPNPFTDRGSSARATAQHSVENLTALPKSTQPRSRSSPYVDRIAEQHDVRQPPHFFTDMMRSSTVRSKRTLTAEQDPPRKKSTQRRNDDFHREQEIKAMSRPASRNLHYGLDVARRGSVRFSRIPGRAFTPALGSTVSLEKELGRADSVRSSITCLSEHHRFDVGARAILSPRPTMRYSLLPPQAAPPQHTYAIATTAAQNQSRSSSRREPRPVSRRSLNQGKVIDDLADDLNAGTIRELLDRDQRRRERRRQHDEDRARRRLERLAARADASSSPTDRKGKQIIRTTPIHVASNDPSALIVVPRPRDSEYHRPIVLGPPVDSPQADPFADPVSFDDAITQMDGEDDETYLQLTMPLVQSLPSSLTEPMHSTHPVQSMQPSNAVPQRRISSTPSPALEMMRTTTASSSNNVKSAQTNRQSSISSRSDADVTRRRGGTFSALFNRTTPGYRGSVERTTPDRGNDARTSSFSNTSRESMSRQPIPVHLVGEPAPARPKSKASLPARTTSKFREDLPELPNVASTTPEQGVLPAATLPPKYEAGDDALPAITENQEPKSPDGQPLVSMLTDAPSAAQRPVLHVEPIPRPDTSPIPLKAKALALGDSEAAWISFPSRHSSHAAFETSTEASDEEFDFPPPPPVPRSTSAHTASTRPATPHHPIVPPIQDARQLSSDIRAALAGSRSGSSNSDGSDPYDLAPRARTYSHGSIDALDETIARRGSLARAPTVVHNQPRVASNEAAPVSYEQASAGHEEYERARGKLYTPSEPVASATDSEAGSPVEYGFAAPAPARYAVQHRRQVSGSGSVKLLDIPARTGSVRSANRSGGGGGTPHWTPTWTPSRTPPPGTPPRQWSTAGVAVPASAPLAAAMEADGSEYML